MAPDQVCKCSSGGSSTGPRALGARYRSAEIAGPLY
jgi:hypothetical protein